MERTKILIIRLSSIGDIILTSAFVRQTRRAFPQAEIHFTVKKKFADLLRFNPHIDKLIEFDDAGGYKELQKLASTIRASNYSHIFDLHNNLRSNRITRGIKPSYLKRISKDKIRRAVLVYLKINLYKRAIAIPQRYLAVGAEAGVQDDQKGLELFWDDAIEKKLDNALSANGIGQRFWAVAPGAGFATKMWPHDYLNKLLKELAGHEDDLPVVLLGSQAERAMFSRLAKTKKVYNLAGKLSLLESAAVLKRADFLLTNDSGLMHMASAVGTPVTAIFGSTVRELGFFPYRVQNKVLEQQLWCRPCSHVGRRTCPLGHFKCMREITPDIVQKHLNKAYSL